MVPLVEPREPHGERGAWVLGVPVAESINPSLLSAAATPRPHPPNEAQARAHPACYQRPVSPPPKSDEPTAPAYARAGVDLDKDEGFIDEVKSIAKSTFRPEVLSTIGGFAGMFKAPERYKEPIFVAGADGVGTKLKLAALLGRYDTIGIDCVAMVVNDLVVQGAEPLVFLDYIAMGDMDEEIAAETLRGVAEGCKRAGCSLLGGETASMPGFYGKSELELVGFGVGVVERDKVIDGSSIGQGDVVIGVASSGLHSNGFSLVRQIIDAGVAAEKFDLREAPPELNTSLAASLLTPTRIYVKPVLNLARDFDLHGVVHITGGGFEGNIPRILPNGVRARIDPAAWPRPPIFDFLQKHGEIPEQEMRRVFNCGLGLVVMVRRAEADDVIQRLEAMGERGYEIGVIEPKEAHEPALEFGPVPDAAEGRPGR